MTSIFLSYARADDEAFVQSLWARLTASGHQVWFDRKSMPARGLTFYQEIHDAVRNHERLLVVVGPVAVRSHDVRAEWQAALIEGKIVTPLLRLGDYRLIPPELKIFHCPDLRAERDEGAAWQELQRVLADPLLPPGKLHGAAPEAPPHFQPRVDDFSALARQVLYDTENPAVITGPQRITMLHGMGGVGKSVLAGSFARSFATRRVFRDGVFWTTASPEMEPLELLRALLGLLGVSVDPDATVEIAQTNLRERLDGKRCLIVIDNVWEVEQVAPVARALSTATRLLLTARDSTPAVGLGANTCQVDTLSEEAALRLLANWAGSDVASLRETAKAVVRECGGLPFALALQGALAHDGMPWDDLLQALQQSLIDFAKQPLADYQYSTVSASIKVSIEKLQDDDAPAAARFKQLSALVWDAGVPESALARLWRHDDKTFAERDVRELLLRLQRKSLLRLVVDASQRRVHLHDLMRDYLIATTDTVAANLQLLDAYRAASSAGWFGGPDDGYFFDHLAHHLRFAGKEEEWRSLNSSFDWLERKTRACGFVAVLQDLVAYSNDIEIGPLYRACRPAAHILTNDPSQVAAQFLARLDPSKSPVVVRRLLERAAASRESIWLRPLSASLAEGGESVLAVFRGREKDGHAGTPRSVAISADGRLIASGGGSSNDLTVKIWSAEHARLLRTYTNAVEAGGITRLAFFASYGLLAGATGDEIRVYSVDAEMPIARRAFHGARISAISGSGQTGMVFIGFDDGCVLAWTPANDTTAKLRESDRDNVVALAHASASPRLVVATESFVECWDTENSRALGKLNEPSDRRFSHPLWQPGLAIAPNGSKVFLADPARVWTVGKSTANRILTEDIALRTVAVAASGEVILYALDDSELVAVDAANERRMGRIRNSREFSCVALSGDGRAVVTGDYEHDVKFWVVANSETSSPAWEQRGPVESTAICDENGFALVGAADEHELWDTSTGTPLPKQKPATRKRVTRRGKRLPDFRAEETVRGMLSKALDDSSDGALGLLAFSQSARRAVSARAAHGKGWDGEEDPFVETEDSVALYVWDLDNVSKPRKLRGHTAPITSMDLTTDGTHALTGSRGRLLRLWDLDSGECLHVLRGHRGIVSACALTDDATLAVSGSEDMTVRLWDLVDGRLLFTFATSSWVTACDIARDAALAIAGETSGRVHMFRVIGPDFAND